MTRGNAVKYLLRCGRKTKDKKVDLNKALWYARRALVNGEKGADEVMEKAKKEARAQGHTDAMREVTKEAVEKGLCPFCRTNKPEGGGACCKACLGRNEK